MDSSARLRHFLHDNRPLILDGGLATELEAQGAKLQVKPVNKRVCCIIIYHVKATHTTVYYELRLTG